MLAAATDNSAHQNTGRDEEISVAKVVNHDNR